MRNLDTITARISRRLALRGAGAIGLGAALGVPARATARQGTPAATPAAGGNSVCAGDPGVGDAVSVVGPEGTEIAVVTVTEQRDPFDDYNPNAPPQAGQRFAVVGMRVEVTGPRPFRVDPFQLFVQDAEGFVYQPASISLPDENSGTLLQGEELATGGQIEGLVGFSVLRGAELVRLFFQPQGDRLLLLADLRR